MNNRIIGVGNAGTQIAKLAATSKLLRGSKIYAIDSTTVSIDINSVSGVKFIPIISDDKTGSGRDRERGSDMFKYHMECGSFNDLMDDAMNAKTPVIIVTSAAGGTGSGSTPQLFKMLTDADVFAIPIIILPALDDPMAYHMNTTDLFYELGQIDPDLKYCTFRNPSHSMHYDAINRSVVNAIEVVFGLHYDHTSSDTIDESDIDRVFRVPGRFVAASVEAANVDELHKKITHSVLAEYQPAWDISEIADKMIVMAFSLTSMSATDSDYQLVFKDIKDRIPMSLDEYRNAKDDISGTCKATAIIGGLPRPELKSIESDFKTVNSLGVGLTQSKRPDFMKSRKLTPTSRVTAGTKQGSNNGGSKVSDVKWKK
jgi:hypothetical protein